MVRTHPDPPSLAPDRPHGGLAQLGEHLLCKQGVVGSIPSTSTNIASRQSQAQALCLALIVSINRLSRSLTIRKK